MARNSPVVTQAQSAQGRKLGREILRTAQLAWPVVLAQLAIVGMNLVDTVLAGRVSAQILGEVAIGSAVWGVLLLWLIGTMMAVAPAVSSARGAQRPELLADTLCQAIYLGIIVVLVALLVAPLLPFLMQTLRVDASLIPGAMSFVHGVLWGAPALTWYIALQKFCEGMGRTRPGLYFSGIGLLLLMPLCFALLNGAWGLPRYLAFGAGLATAIVHWFCAIGMTIYVYRQFAELDILRRWSRPKFDQIKALAGVGVPIAVTILMEAGLFYSVLLLMSRFGTQWVAAHAVAINVASIAFMMPLGLANAVTVRTGFARGQNDLAGQWLAGIAGISLCLMTQALSASVMLLFALPIASLYLPNDLPVAMMAAQFLFLAAIFQFPDGVQAVCNGALRGMQDTKVPMLLTMIAYWALGFPLAYGLAFFYGFGPQGLWYGFILGLSAAMCLLGARFWRLTRAPA